MEYYSVGGDGLVDSELKIRLVDSELKTRRIRSSTHSLGSAYRGRVCVNTFIDVSVCTYV
jgi:hypothetical protein